MHVVKVVTSRTIYDSLVTERTDWVLDGGKFYLKVEGISMEGKEILYKNSKKSKKIPGFDWSTRKDVEIQFAEFVE